MLRVLTACLFSAVPMMAQVLSPLPDHVVQMVEALYQRQNPNSCVWAFAYDRAGGANYAGGSSGGACSGNPVWREAYAAVNQQAASLRLRAGYFFYVYEAGGRSGRLAPIVVDAVAACCLAAYRTSENTGTLHGSGTTARGGSFQLHAANAQTTTAMTAGILTLGSASHALLRGMLVVDPATFVASIPFPPQSGGVASVRLQVPAAPQLVGLDLYIQAVHVDPTSVVEPHRLTNGLIVTLV